MLEVDTCGTSRVVAPEGASPVERRFMHVATPAAGGSLDCSFDKIHNLIYI